MLRIQFSFERTGESSHIRCIFMLDLHWSDFFVFTDVVYCSEGNPQSLFQLIFWSALMDETLFWGHVWFLSPITKILR